MARVLTQRLAKQVQRQAEDGFYTDKAVLLQDVGTGSYDANNFETMTVTETTLTCSFTDKPTKEIWRDYADIEDIQAEIRFRGHTPAKGNRIKLTGQYDNGDYPDKTFEIIGIQNRDVFGWVCALKAVAI